MTPVNRGAVGLRAQMHQALAELHPCLERLFNLAQAEALEQHAEPRTSRFRQPRTHTAQGEPPS